MLSSCMRIRPDPTPLLLRNLNSSCCYYVTAAVMLGDWQTRAAFTAAEGEADSMQAG